MLNKAKYSVYTALQSRGSVWLLTALWALSCVAPHLAAGLHPAAAPPGGDGSLGPLAGQTWLVC